MCKELKRHFVTFHNPNLTSQEGDTRSFAAASLAYHVTEHRTQHPGEDDILSKAPKEATSDSTTGDMSERDRIKAKAKALGTVDMAYALKRLVRGLCSSRGGARQGFATGLTLMMQRTTNAQMSVQNVYEVVREVSRCYFCPSGTHMGACCLLPASA